MSNVKAKSIFDKMVEANIEITNLAYENKQMAKFLNLIGLSVDDITDKIINSKSQLDRNMVSKIQCTLKQLEILEEEEFNIPIVIKKQKY